MYPQPPDWTAPPPEGPPPADEGGRRILVGIVGGGLAIVTAASAVLLLGRDDGSGTADRVEALSSTTTLVATTGPSSTARPAAQTGVLCIGDSIMFSVSPFGTLSACGTVDAADDRRMAEAREALRSHAPYPDTVVIHLGSDAPFEREELDAMLGELRSVPTVVLVTVQLNQSQPWEGAVNAEILAARDRFPNVRVADWVMATGGHPNYFSGTGGHLSQFGAEAYGALIAETISAD